MSGFSGCGKQRQFKSTFKLVAREIESQIKVINRELQYSPRKWLELDGDQSMSFSRCNLPGSWDELLVGTRMWVYSLGRANIQRWRGGI